MNESRNDGFLVSGVAMVAAMVMIAQHIAAKATRDALFLTHFDVSRLPALMMVSAALSVAAVLLMSRLLTRFGPARLIPPLYALSALLLAVQWSLTTSMPRVASVALYLHASALNSILISGFWSVVNERFDPYSAKQIIPKLTAAATFGGVLGGLGAKAVSTAADTNAIVLMLSAMHLGCGIAVAILARGVRHQGGEAEEIPGDLLAPLTRSPLILRMALLTLCVSTTAGVLDYILKAQASAELSSDDLITFFSYFYTAVGLGTFLLQSSLGKSALRWFGLGGAMAAWPIAILIAGGGALAARSLVSVALLRGSANLLYNSFFRAGFELLYTPIAPADKRAGKVLIDVGAERSGDLVSGLLISLVLGLAVASESVLLALAILLAMVCLALMAILNRGYVAQLADNLRSGSLRADELEVLDATTAHTIAVTQTSIERDQLLKQISSLELSASSDASHAPAPQGSHAVTGARALDPVGEAIAEIRSGDATRIKRILTGQKLTPQLLPHVIPMLADERVLQDALTAIREVASQVPGQLVDALLDPAQHPLVKRRLPLLLARSASALAVHGLSEGLDDPDWNVRYRCARGLNTLRRRNPGLRAGDKRLTHAVDQELRSLVEARSKAAASGAPAAIQRRVEMLFLLFGVQYDPEVLELCLVAVQSDDAGLRGTALEYLENLLPGEIWVALRPVVSRGVVASEKRRSLKESERELLASAPTLRERRQPLSDDSPSVDRLGTSD